MNIVLVLAAGVGCRAHTDVPKQFIEVHSVPVMVHTMRHFQECEQIDAICAVTLPEWKDRVKSYAIDYNIPKLKWVVDGGNTGLESVKKGILALGACADDDIILIHDSVRPFISQHEITDNILVATKHGVAVTAVPCVETLIKTDANGKSEYQIPRDGLMRVMTPQSFSLGILRDLFEKVDVSRSIFPSTFALYMSTGKPVYCSSGSEKNIKITYPEDVEYFRNLFNNE